MLVFKSKHIVNIIFKLIEVTLVYNTCNTHVYSLIFLLLYHYSMLTPKKLVSIQYGWSPLPISSPSHLFLSGNHYSLCPCVCFYLVIHLFCFFLKFFKYPTWVKSHSICLSLTYFNYHDALKVHPCCSKWQDFIFFLMSE